MVAKKMGLGRRGEVYTLSHTVRAPMNPVPTTPRGTARGTGGAARKARAKPPAPRAEAAAADPSVDGNATRRIVDSITTAIVERRLMPGTKLAEQQIADIFKVSRTLVRQALNQLSRDRLVTLLPARGAFVAQPGVEEARQVFEVRQLLETAMLQRLARQITDEQVQRLREHLAAEREALARTDVPGRTRLLADFHVLLARMLGNEVLADLLADLLSRSSLIALMYQSSHSAEASQDEHALIVDALARRDGKAAVKLIADHLGNVERNLRLNPRVRDLAAALGANAG
jgi:DNA-binding GntR family transcriptional regulator